MIIIYRFDNFHLIVVNSDVFLIDLPFQGSVLDGMVYVFIILFFAVVYNIIKFFELTTIFVEVK